MTKQSIKACLVSGFQKNKSQLNIFNSPIALKKLKPNRPFFKEKKKHMFHSYHDRVNSVLQNLEFYEFYPNVDPDEIFYLSRDTYFHNYHQLECHYLIFHKLSPCSVQERVLETTHPIFDFLILENLSMWSAYVRQHFETLFPLVMDTVHAERNSCMLEILTDEIHVQLQRATEMMEKSKLDFEELIRLEILKGDLESFLRKLENFKKKYQTLFLSIFYHGKFSKKINSQDIVREIYSFL